MNFSSDELSTMVFRRVVRDDLGEFSLDSQMLSMLMELDGKRNLGVICQKIGIDLNASQTIINRLVELKLIETARADRRILDNSFFQYLKEQLILAIGPVAEIFIEDAVADLGYDLSNFPSDQAAELVDLLSREIQRDEKLAAFKRNMVNKIRETSV
ncbi:MAG: hypothetical protein QNI92_11375 [Desulfobacterales bacterium]|nr:hypothetical protein [Desulfobacterales bacterium]